MHAGWSQVSFRICQTSEVRKEGIGSDELLCWLSARLAKHSEIRFLELLIRVDFVLPRVALGGIKLLLCPLKSLAIHVQRRIRRVRIEPVGGARRHCEAVCDPIGCPGLSALPSAG